MQATVKRQNLEWTFSDADVLNIDNYIPEGDYNPHRVRPWLLHDHGRTLCVVFADCLQDALDIAADEDKLDRYAVSEGNADHFAYLGNAGEPFDIETLGCVELDNPPMSFAALYKAM